MFEQSMEHQVQTCSGNPPFQSHCCLDLTPNGNVGDGKRPIWSWMCPFWPAHRSSLQSCPRAWQNPALIKRRASFTRRHYSTVKWLVIVSFSVRAPDVELPNRQKTKPTSQNSKEEKESGTENMGGGAGSKHPTPCNAVLFKPNSFRNPQSRVPSAQRG